MVTDRLGKYEIRGTLGKGAMGTVYSAWDPIISRTVAIKTVRLPDASDIDAQEELARFKREAQAAGRLTHPNIVGIFDYGETDEVAYIVMEFVEGRTLKSILDGEERMSVPTIAQVMADLLAGLRYSHERGVVHRDIKPANIMIVGGDGSKSAHNSGQAKIADFGIARIESSNLTQAGTIMGTPAYMSPEQFMGQTVDARTDIYSSGVLLFQLLTGERPFEGSMATIMHKALNTSPPKPSELSVTAPVALDAVVARAMARRPDDRYPDAGAFAAAIVDALAGRTPASGLSPGLGDLLGDDVDTDSTVVQSTPRPVSAESKRSPAPEPVKQRSKAPLFAGVAVVALAAAGAGGAWWAGLIGAPEPSNAQIAGGIRTVPSPGNAAPPVVAVAPPSAPDASSSNTTVAASTEPSTPPAPTPIAGVTQVVPPSTSAPEMRPSPVAPEARSGASAPEARPGASAPEARPTPSTAEPRQTASAPEAATSASAPEARPATAAQVVPPAPPVPTQAPPAPPTRSPTRTEIARAPRLEPAVVTPPAGPDRVEPTPAAAGTAPPAVIATAPPVIPPPPQVRAPEPQVTPPPQPVVQPTPPTAPEQPPTARPIETAPPPPAPPTVTAAIVSPEALRRAVATAVEGADCAVVRGDLTRAGTVSMQGVIGTGEPVQSLLRHVRDVAPNAPLDWTVQEAPGPYCGVLNTIRAFTRPFGSVTGGMEIGLRDGRTDLREKDPIDIRAQLPNFPSYLQIDYFSSDGSVAHVRTAAQGGPLLPARSLQSGGAFEVGEPYGTDLIVSIASSVPLFSKDQALSDKGDEYLRQLRTALDAAIKRRSELAAGAVVLRTSPKS